MSIAIVGCNDVAKLLIERIRTSIPLSELRIITFDRGSALKCMSAKDLPYRIEIVDDVRDAERFLRDVDVVIESLEEDRIDLVPILLDSVQRISIPTIATNLRDTKRRNNVMYVPPPLVLPSLITARVVHLHEDVDIATFCMYSSIDVAKQGCIDRYVSSNVVPLTTELKYLDEIVGLPSRSNDLLNLVGVTLSSNVVPDQSSFSNARISFGVLKPRNCVEYLRSFVAIRRILRDDDLDKFVELVAKRTVTVRDPDYGICIAIAVGKLPRSNRYRVVRYYVEVREPNTVSRIGSIALQFVLELLLGRVVEIEQYPSILSLLVENPSITLRLLSYLYEELSDFKAQQTVFS